MIKNIFLISLFLIISGCASIVDGSSQIVTVTPMKSGIINTNTMCLLSNKKGEWTTYGGGVVNLKKSGDDLHVRCTDNQTKELSYTTAKSNTNAGWAIANFFFWDLCTISCLIDFSSGSIYEYPSQIKLYMNDIPKDSILNLDNDSP